MVGKRGAKRSARATKATCPSFIEAQVARAPPPRACSATAIAVSVCRLSGNGASTLDSPSASAMNMMSWSARCSSTHALDSRAATSASAAASPTVSEDTPRSPRAVAPRRHPVVVRATSVTPAPLATARAGGSQTAAISRMRSRGAAPLEPRRLRAADACEGRERDLLSATTVSLARHACLQSCEATFCPSYARFYLRRTGARSRRQTRGR